MSVGVSLFTIALGAILKFAVTARADGINISTVGEILMVVGVVGLVVSLSMAVARYESSPERTRRERT